MDVKKYKKSVAYWKKRALERESTYQGGSEKTIKTMQNVYNRAFENVEERIKVAYNQLGKIGVNAEDAIAYQERLSMLEKLQNDIFNECKSLENIEQKVTTRRYASVMNEGYYRNIFDLQKGVGLAFDFNKLPKSAIKETMLEGWKGRTFSKSIWGNTGKIASLTEEIVKAGFLSGASIETMVTQLDEVMKKGQFVSERLIRSETSYFANQGELKAYEQAGIEKYEYMATLDTVTSKTCIALDGEIFNISEAQVGRNYPPVHAFCRSTTIAHFADKNINDLQRRARDPITGKTIVLDKKLNYTQWYDQNVKEKPEAELKFTMRRNFYTDKKQLKDYTDILGINNLPKTIEEFQQMKYNDVSQYNMLQSFYKYKNKYPKSTQSDFDLNIELKKAKLIKGEVAPLSKEKVYILEDKAHKKDPTHIMKRMLERQITDDDIQAYINNAILEETQFKGTRRVFYSDDGVAVLTKTNDYEGVDWIVKTAWNKHDFDETTIKLLEAVKKHAR